MMFYYYGCVVVDPIPISATHVRTIIVARDTSCGLLDLSGTRRSAWISKSVKIKTRENSAYRYRVLESHPWQPRLLWMT